MTNKTGKKLGYKDGGFTIIEVMIVLAVAGLIMAIVLIAIPQLQRSQRNSARRDVTNRIKTEIDSFAGNNNGRVPSTAADLDSVYLRYLGCTPNSITASAPGTACATNIDGPSSGTPVPMNIPAVAVTGFSAVGTQDSIRYQIASSCNGESIQAQAGNRNYAMWIDLEGGAVYCVDNS